jgi:UDP-GlcNAc:undecaprenyl-phosphate GlcNAc-1-phosphate transferase
MHKSDKSRAGGIAVFGAFMLGLVLNPVDINIYLILSFLLVFFLGIYDDINGTSSKIKFFWIGLSATVMYFGDFYISSLGIFNGYELSLNHLFAYVLLLFAIVGFVNAMNLIDGLDGLAAGISIVILFAFAYMGYKYKDVFLFYIPSYLMIALFAFLFFNWFPSKIFIGDSGSLTLGLVIGICSIYAINHGYITPSSVLLLAAVPILDTLIVFTRRILNKQNPFDADRKHIHHVFLKQQKSVPRSSLLLILLQFIFTYIGLGFKVRDDILILVIFVLFFILFYFLLTPSKKPKI